MSVSMNNVVRLVNEGPNDFVQRYGPRDRLVIPAGTETYVMQEVAWHFLGRWWTDNSNPKLRERQSEVRRLRVLYGAYEDDKEWERMRPRLVAYNPDGQRIISVLDEPEGAATGRDLGSGLDVETRMVLMQQEMARMQSQLDATVRERDARAEFDPTADNPSAPPVPSPTIPMPRTGTLPDGTVLPVAPPPFLPPGFPAVGSTAVSLEDGYEPETGLPPRLPTQVEVLATPLDDELGDANAQPSESSFESAPPDMPNRVRVGSPE